MFNHWKIGILCLCAVGLASCDDDDDDIEIVSETFTVTIENVSTPNLVTTTRANGTVPLSPGVYAVYSGDDPVFTLMQPADAGLELIAEDGETAQKTAALQSMADVMAGSFEAAGGGAITAGASGTFTFEASPGEKLQIATMFVQSNDWFYAFRNGGLDLFNGLNAIDGDITSELVLYDAGTEADTEPGTGPDQKPAQPANVINQGPDDAVDQVQVAATRHPTFTIPATTSVIRVTISHQ